MPSALKEVLGVQDVTRRRLLQELGLSRVPESQIHCLELPDLLTCSRVKCVSKSELYFLQDASQLKEPLNLRNEAAAVSLLLSHLSEAGSGAVESRASLIDALADHARSLWPELAHGDVTLSSITGSGGSSPADGGSAVALQGLPAPPGSAAADFEAWAVDQGVSAGIRIASFGGLRGCAAARDLAPGDLLLSLPEQLLIWEGTVRQTDLGRMLAAIPGLTTDNLLIIFTMIDRHDEESQWARYWRSLPAKFFTGLSFPPQLVDSLAGTAAHLELARAQEHLRQQYADTRPLFDMLLAAYPALLQPGWFEYDGYLWAAELWYGYAFDIEFPEDSAGPSKATLDSSTDSQRRSMTSSRGSSRSKRGARGGSSQPKPATNGGAAGSSGGGSHPVMVPFACHVNHSPWPHCVRYGRLNPATRTLDFPAFRPCPQGQQVFISYGPVPNLKLLVYYGFAVPSNPHDLVPLQLEPPEGPLAARQRAALSALGLDLEHSLQDGPLSRQLLACLRVIVATPAELRRLEHKKTDPVAGPVGADNEDQALRTLEAALLELLQPLEQLPLLAGTGADAAQPCSHVAGAAAAQSELQQLSLAQGAEQGLAAEQDPAAAVEQGPAAAGGDANAECNENGFDEDWRLSTRFCQLYLEGQRHILRSSLAECRRLLQAATAAGG